MNLKKPDLADQCKLLFDDLVEWRRHFHTYPELSFQEAQTSKKVVDLLESFGGFEIEKGVGGYGVVATLSYGPGPVVGIRADMDALPIQEQNSFSWKSRNPGVMHACGHDAHTAILLGIARLLSMGVLSGEGVKGTIKLIFQPAEEKADKSGETGAVKMLQTGRLSDMDAVLALHMCPWRSRGQLQMHDGPSMANNDEFHIRVKGSGGHAGYPQHAVDPIWISAHVLSFLYSSNGRKVDPMDVGVISIGEIHAGEASNIIPDVVDIKGTCRSYTEAVRSTLIEQIHQIPGMVKILGGECEVNVIQGEPALVNDKRVNDAIKSAAGPMEIIHQPFGMGSEDFSHFSKVIPGAMFFLGCGLDRKTNLHQPDFDFDDWAMVDGVQVMVGSVFQLLNRIGGEAWQSN
ncbi:M20 family metallopeptidase [Halobacillus yeomjeoni]|uniref:M20 metallopeptidase family protein n=1 Tax=Halobacillus yeomjeoni TaxID=311194 RepID=UPI001CD4D447|nr:M20 family metallopeptidase [Halobacillus yeomjeoni]MCA0984769.1 M20 family metallopeptidase [Halobacillus yeomjeoni]